MAKPRKSAPGDAVQRPRQGAADALYRHFAEQINSGALREGQPLPPEREIVEAHGVSRTVVREAVKALSNRGLVVARPRHRPVVRQPSYEAAMETLGDVTGRLLREIEGVQNLYDTRILIEAALVRQAATEARPAEINALAEALEANSAAVDDNETFFETDIRFHAVLYAIPGNPVLPALHHAYTRWLSPHWLAMPRSANRNQINAQAHNAIFTAICARDADAAETALRRHLDDAWEQVRATFGEA